MSWIFMNTWQNWTKITTVWMKAMNYWTMRFSNLALLTQNFSIKSVTLCVCINSIYRQGFYLPCIACICGYFCYSMHAYEKHPSISLSYITDYDQLFLLDINCYLFFLFKDKYSHMVEAENMANEVHSHLVECIENCSEIIDTLNYNES